jgi:predicted DsbA family dithiol-disulfide isomerase
LGRRERTYNSRLAQELGKWAESCGKGDDYHRAVFRAYFVDGKNIGNISVLVELAGALSLPQEEAREVLEERKFKREVNEDWSRAYSLGISAVPTMLLNQKAIVGAQSYEVMERFMEMSGIKKRR